MKELYFAGGCFWGVEEYFSRIGGVLNTEVGYANGNTDNPTYEQVCRENTGFAETVRVEYDEKIISTEELVERFFRIIDPTSLNRQGNDVGSQYRSGIYYIDPLDRDAIEKIVNKISGSYEKRIVTEIYELKNYYLAEEYHQRYLKKNPKGYCHISFD